MKVATEQPGQPPTARRDDPARLQETEAWQNLARRDQGAAQADVQYESGRSDHPRTHTGDSARKLMIEATAGDVAELEATRDAMIDAGHPEQAAEAERWLGIAREDHAAAVAGVDYRDLAGHFGPQSAATPERAAAYWPCGYPETHARQLAAAELETGREAGQ